MSIWIHRQHALKKAAMLLITVVVAMASSFNLSADLTLSNFEIDADANLKLDGTAPAEDWNQILPPDPQGSDGPYRFTDQDSGSNDNSFGQGTKEDDSSPSVVTGSIPPNKSDLKEFGVYLEENGSERFLHLFWTRVQDPSGTTNMDFEFNSGEAGLNADDLPIRVPGDVLLVYELSKGGTVPIILISIWIDGSDGETSAQCEASNSLPCWSTLTDLGSLAEGAINSTAIPANESDLGALSARTFGEATIDFGQLVGTENCVSFGYATLKSRSSDSFTSALKDFIAPQNVSINNCSTISVTKKDDQTPASLLEGAEFTLFEDAPPDIGGTYDADTDDKVVDTCTTNVSGYCTFESVAVGDYWVAETKAPDGYDLSNMSPWPVTISLGDGSLDLEFTNNRIPATLTFYKQDEVGAALAGAIFTLYEDAGGGTLGNSTGKTCTSDASGTCYIDGILPDGDYCIDETTVPSGYTKATGLPDCFSLALDQDLVISEAFVNNRQAASITINKKDETGTVLAGAVFTLFKDAGDGSPGDTTGKTCTTNASGTCSIGNILPPGNYCVDETTVPTGYDKAEDLPKCFSLDLNQSLTLPDIINARQPASITINKQDDAGTALAGAQFTLYEAGEGGALGSSTGKTCSTDSSGTCSIDDILPPGNYCVDETIVPTGYNKDSSLPHCFSLSLNQALTLPTFTNPRKTGAILITKTRKHAADGAGDHAHQGVTFSTSGGSLTSNDVQQTDASGQICVEGLILSTLPGIGNYTVTETVPTGYVADGDNPKTVSVTEEATCLEGTKATVSFANTPLTNFTVTVDSQVDGGTASDISCTGPGNNDEGSAATGADGDGSLNVNNKVPGTYVCTIVIDP